MATADIFRGLVAKKFQNKKFASSNKIEMKIDLNFQKLAVVVRSSKLYNLLFHVCET